MMKRKTRLWLLSPWPKAVVLCLNLSVRTLKKMHVGILCWTVLCAADKTTRGQKKHANGKGEITVDFLANFFRSYEFLYKNREVLYDVRKQCILIDKSLCSLALPDIWLR